MKKFTLFILLLSLPSLAAAPKGRVLVIVSAADKVPLREGGTHAAGVFLGELVEPAEALLDAGYELAFASPGGRAPTMDPESYKLTYWHQSPARLEHAKAQLTRLERAGLYHPLEMERLARDEEKPRGA